MRRFLSAACAVGLLYSCGDDRGKLVNAPVANMLSPFGLTATKGLADHVRLDWSMPEGSELTSFRIERDGVEIAVVASNRTTYLDTSAAAGMVETPRPPEIRSERDRVTVEWTAPATHEGASHSYTVVADYVGVERRSEAAVGSRGEPAITGYVVRRDGAVLATLPPTASSYDDVALAPGAAEPPAGLKVKAGEASVSLSWSEPGVHAGVSYLYTIEAVSEVGTTEASAGRRGARLAGEILGYLIERDGRPIASVPASVLSYEDTGAISGTLAPSAAFTATEEDEGIRLEWSSATALPGFEHTYGVMAVTADSVGLPATAGGHRSAPVVTAYRVLRDGVLVASLPPTASSFVDTGAASGVLGSPTALTLANTATGTTLTWAPPAGSQGGTYRYELVAASDLGQATASSIATASRGAPAVAEYVVLRDGVEIARLPPSVTTYEDRGASSQLDPPALGLTPSAEAIDLRWQPPSTVGSSFHTWQVVAVRADGQRSGPASASGSSASSLSQYIVTRDGVEIAVLPPGTTSYRDVGALPGTVDAPVLEVRPNAQSVTLRWEAPAVHPGPSHLYQVKAITAVGTAVASLELPAARTAPSITGYRIDRDWMPLVSLTAAHRTYDDTSATAGDATAAELQVSAGVDSVGLSWQPATTTSGQSRSYELYVLAGSSAVASPEVVAGRVDPAIVGYRLYRDGASIATLAPSATAFDDDGAAPGTIGAMGPVTVNAGVGSIELRWQAPTTSPGTTHVYTLDTQIDTGAAKTSSPKTGQRAAPALSAFQIARDGAAVATLPASATSYDDVQAGAGSFVGTLSLALAPRVDAIRLDWTPPSAQGGSPHAYTVLPIAGAVSGAASAPVSAARTAPAITGYTVMRDGASIATLPAGATSHEDAASAGSVDAPTGLAAAGDVDSVQLDWTAAVVHAGATHAYTVVAATDMGPALNSETTPAARIPPAILGYRVLRDGIEIASTAATTFTDGGASPGTLREPTAVVASQGTRLDGVTVTWAPAATEPGALHQYAVIADTDVGPTAPSAPAQARRLEPAIVGYEVSRDQGSWMTAGLGTSYDDTSAPHGDVSAVATAQPNDVLGFIELDLVAPPAFAPAPPSTYEVRAVTAAGPGPVSAATMGFRGGGPVPDLTFQWQRSAADSDGAYADLPGATDAATLDKTNPLDEGRYYRLAFASSEVSGWSTPARAMALSFSGVSAGARHTCGVRSDGSAVCWGSTADGRSNVPSGIRLLSIAAGGRHTCGLRTDRRVQCWGHDGDRQARPPNLDAFQAISAGEAHTCGVRRSGRDMECWGNDGSNRSSPPWFGVDWRAVVSAGGRHTCAINDNDRAECWGSSSNNQTRIPNNLGRIVDITAGDDHTCAVQQSGGSVVCWGNNSYGQTSRPSGSFLRVSAGTRHTCGLRTNGTVACWGSSADGRLAVPAGTYKAVSAGADHACGIHTDGRIDCWGRNAEGQAPRQP
ncbi:MAG TPA: hypothetical protein VN033_05670 [Vulgatibacter sp.]|nr:hypothetical protein [Vulgatibacter sp.]